MLLSFVKNTACNTHQQWMKICQSITLSHLRTNHLLVSIGGLCLFFFFLENIGQKKVIHSKGFVILTFKSSRVLLLKSKRSIRRCLGCRKKKVKYRSSRRMVYLGRDIFLPILIEYLLQEPSLC